MSDELLERALPTIDHIFSILIEGESVNRSQEALQQ